MDARFQLSYGFSKLHLRLMSSYIVIGIRVEYMDSPRSAICFTVRVKIERPQLSEFVISLPI
jgi:hypothetical protein